MRLLVEKIIKISEDVFQPATQQEVADRKLKQHQVKIDEIKKDIISRSKKGPNGLIVQGNISSSYIPFNSIKDLGLQIDTVDGDFRFSSCQLKDLQGSPRVVTGTFSVESNQIENLLGGPQQVGGEYDCSRNKITSLEGAPKVVSSFDCSSNALVNLVGGPLKCKGRYVCRSNKLTSLQGIPNEIGSFYCERNANLKDLSALTTTRVRGEVQIPNIVGMNLKNLDYKKLRIGGGVKVYDSVTRTIVERLESDMLRFLKPMFGKARVYGAGIAMNQLQFDKITDDDITVNENPSSLLKDVKSGKYNNFYIYWILTTLDGKDTKAYTRTEFRRLRLPYLLASGKGNEITSENNDFKMYDHIKTISDFADLAVLIPADKFEVEAIQNKRRDQQHGAEAFRAHGSIQAENQKRYSELLANKRASIDFKTAVKQLLDLATQLAFDTHNDPKTLSGYNVIRSDHSGNKTVKPVDNPEQTVERVINWIWYKMREYNRYTNTQSSNDDYYSKQALQTKNKVLSALAGLKDKKIDNEILN